VAGFDYDKDADGIVTITMDMPGQSANTMSPAWLVAMNSAIDRLRVEPNLRGVIFTSAKKTFFAGGDLNSLLEIQRADEATFAMVEANKQPYRALEKLPVPVVAAINGAALGGGYELCLACNRRIVVDLERAVVGLPEVTLGMLPGAGGIVRLTCSLGLEQALPLLLEGTRLCPADALKAGLVDEIVPSVERLIPAAKAWIIKNAAAHSQPWDQKGFRYPGGDAIAPNIRQFVAAAPNLLIGKTRGLLPAKEKILDVAVNSMRTGFDAALRAESRGLTALLATTEAKAAITTFFFGVQAVRAGKFRPSGDRWQARSSAVLGEGPLGSGIVWAHANMGLPTVLMAPMLEKATMLQGDYDIIIEAVPDEERQKERIVSTTFTLLASGGIYGSNASTLPISLLAKSCPDPARLIGMNFFAPVDKLKMVEIVVGELTSDDTLRKACDHVQRMGYMPIVVNDARGFFISRVFGTFMDEGLQLLEDGMNPVAIERAAWKRGMRLGPLAVHDVVSMVLTSRMMAVHKRLDERLGHKSGFGARNTAMNVVSAAMCELGRGGRHCGQGFYEYGGNGRKKLWSGLTRFKLRNMRVPMVEAEDRLLYRQAIETLHCLDEGVIRSEIEANLGSIIGCGFPAHTGGALQFIRGIGIDCFAARSADLARRHGSRFAISAGALDKLRRANPLVICPHPNWDERERLQN
jgi:3-hydroxyacyl-CoA dehydrogenase/enoyl-CoA hydratase/3-hydroxybutyryl-CoA epimerase